MARTKLFINQGPPKLQGIPKLRHKEEKKQMIKLCMKKLKTIEDTESLLCKSVLIVNTIRKIRKINEDYNLELISCLGSISNNSVSIVVFHVHSMKSDI